LLLVYKLHLRQAEGFLRSLLRIRKLALGALDHTTLSMRCGQPRIALNPSGSSGRIDLVVDSAGVAIVAQGKWASAKNGKRGRRGGRELHIGVNGAGEIVAQVLTVGNADDGDASFQLIEQIKCNI
jgi:hypothetical protein